VGCPKWVFGKWKHEEPLPEDKSDTDTESVPVIGLLGTVAAGKRPAGGHKVNRQEHQHQREASHPYF
jgi:hypothetical protein